MPPLFGLACKDPRSLRKMIVQEDAKAEPGIGPLNPHNVIVASYNGSCSIKSIKHGKSSECYLSKLRLDPSASSHVRRAA